MKYLKTFEASSLSKTVSNEITIWLNEEEVLFDHPYIKPHDLYNFVNKVLKDGFKVEKSKLLRRDVEPSGI